MPSPPKGRGAVRWIAVLLLLGSTACVSSRYVGSVGRDRSFVNRGFGFMVRLAHDSLSERFDAVVAENRKRYPAAIRPREVEAPLDLDGDGFLDVTETTRHFLPALRLISRTSTAVRIDVDVQILSKKNASAPLDQIAMADLMKSMTSTTSTTTADALEARLVGTGFSAVVYEVEGKRVALIDQPKFVAEEGIERRQLVRVTLVAPKIDDAWRREHESVLSALILNQRGSIESTKEEW